MASIQTHQANTTNSNSNTALLEFQAGVSAVLRTWSAFKTAVLQEWGGADSQSKAEALRSLIFQHCNGSSCMEVYELEDNLALYMEEEFSLILEDDSERHVANSIVQMYQQCSQGEFSLSREMVAVAERIRLQGGESNNNNVTIISQGEIEEEDDDDDGGEECHQVQNLVATTATKTTITAVTNNNVASITSATILDYATGELFSCGTSRPKKVVDLPRQLGEESVATNKDEPILDEDGFAVITTRRHRK